MTSATEGRDPVIERTADAGAEASAASGAATTPAPDDGAGRAGGDSAVYRVVEVSSVAFPLPSPNPVVHLREVDAPYRGIEFPLGLAEAQSIAMAIDQERAPRPSAHELLAAVLAATGADVVAVRLVAAREGTLFAELDLMTSRGREVLDCRPSDAIAVALRQRVPAPILCEDSLLDG